MGAQSFLNLTPEVSDHISSHRTLTSLAFLQALHVAFDQLFKALALFLQILTSPNLKLVKLVCEFSRVGYRLGLIDDLFLNLLHALIDRCPEFDKFFGPSLVILCYVAELTFDLFFEVLELYFDCLL